MSFAKGSKDSSAPNVTELERRAEAAERTVEVLKRKVFEMYNGGSGSTLHRQLESARRRDDDNRRKRDLMELRARELKHYSELLEADVARRTESIKTILNNVTFGFLVIDRDLVVQPESTRSCRRLFDAQIVEGRNLCDLLGLEGRPRLELVLGVDQVFEDILPAEVSVMQMHRTFTMTNGTILNLEPSPIRNASGLVTGLLCTISDTTALEEATRESRNNRTLVGILRQKESFKSFLAEAKRLVAAAVTGIAAGNQTAVRQAIHTIKGNAASYGMDDLVAKIHGVEESPEISAAQIDDIREYLRTFLKNNESVLGFDYDGNDDTDANEGFEVSRGHMTGLDRLISSMPSTHAEALRVWSARILRKPAWQLLGPIESFSRKLAARLGKSVSFEISGEDTLVDVETMRPILSSTSHLARNAIDHGIESPLQRGDKPLMGALRVAIAEIAGTYVLTFEDDGRGIDVEALESRARELALVSPQKLDSMTKVEKLDLIFVDGLSSAKVATSVSGRGVGMSAVKSAVDRALGTIVVESRANVGTKVTITVPKDRHATGEVGA